jgi:hypothetical protein
VPGGHQCLDWVPQTSIEFTLLRSAGDEYLFAGEQGNRDELTNNRHRINFMDKAIIRAAAYNAHMNRFSTQGPDFLDAEQSPK